VKNCDVQIDGAEIIRDQLDKLSDAIKGDNELMVPVYEAIGIAGSQIFDNIINEQGKRTGGWDDLSPITKILRPRGTHGVYHSIEEAENDDSHKILQDTNMGKNSFLPGHTGNIMDVDNVSVTIGSRMKRMKSNNAGGTTTFKFGPKQQARFKKNFSDKLPGRAPRRTPTGRKSKAKHNWNKEFFIVFNGLKKKHGESVEIPERRIQPTTEEITDSEKERMTKAMEAGLEDVMQKVGLA
jgi:hypothetical protein